MEVACYLVEVMMVFGEEVGMVLKGEDLALNGLVVVVLTLEWDNRRLEVVGDYAILAHLVEVEGFHIDAMVVVVECKVDDLVVVVAAVMCNGSDDLVMVAVVVEFGHSHDLVVVVVVEFDRSHGLVVVVVEVKCDRSNDLVVAVVVKCDHNDDLVMEAHMQLVVVVVVRQVDR